MHELALIAPLVGLAVLSSCQHLSLQSTVQVLRQPEIARVEAERLIKSLKAWKKTSHAQAAAVRGHATIRERESFIDWNQLARTTMWHPKTPIPKVGGLSYTRHALLPSPPVRFVGITPEPMGFEPALSKSQL